jgi:predicted  nucleic acid-binding Zn-ribbon protein
MDALLKKIQANTKAVGQATQAAHEVSEKLVEQKVEEKEELKEAVVVAETKIEKMEEKIEVYAVKMIGSGIDTTVEEVQFKGVIYEAWLNYVEEGGKEDFNWFRLYIWQPK